MPAQKLLASFIMENPASSWLPAVLDLITYHQERLVVFGLDAPEWANVPDEQGMQIMHDSESTNVVRYHTNMNASFHEVAHYMTAPDVLATLVLPQSHLTRLDRSDAISTRLTLFKDKNDVWIHMHSNRLSHLGSAVGIATLTLANHCTMNAVGEIEHKIDLSTPFTTVGLMYLSAASMLPNHTKVVVCANVAAIHTATVAISWLPLGRDLAHQLTLARFTALLPVDMTEDDLASKGKAARCQQCKKPPPRLCGLSTCVVCSKAACKQCSASVPDQHRYDQDGHRMQLRACFTCFETIQVSATTAPQWNYNGSSYSSAPLSSLDQSALTLCILEEEDVGSDDGDLDLSIFAKNQKISTSTGCSKAWSGTFSGFVSETKSYRPVTCRCHVMEYIADFEIEL
ncbi:hypothetical protein LEN26_009262 [Aphanomyces euteiches]|nr:hypothetical protein LEN26_009262 [Aphanomyces euteiches]